MIWDRSRGGSRRAGPATEFERPKFAGLRRFSRDGAPRPDRARACAAPTLRAVTPCRAAGRCGTSRRGGRWRV